MAAEGDLLDAPAVRRAVEGVSVVYHIAATYREAGQPDSAYRAINVEGTRNILEAAKAAGVTRVVHCSTGGVHGHIDASAGHRGRAVQPGRRVSGDQARRRATRARVRSLNRARCRRGAPDRDLRAGRHAFSADVSRVGSRPLSDDRQRQGVLSPDLHRRSDRRLQAVRHGAGGEGAHLHPGGTALHDARTARAIGREGVERSRRHGCICRCGRSGRRACCAKWSACRCASSRRSIGAASTSTRRAAPSTPPARAPSWDFHRRWISKTGSSELPTGIEVRGCYEPPPNPDP